MVDGTFQDDFGDGNIDGWSHNDSSQYIDISDKSVTGNFSFFNETAGSAGGRAFWSDGPVIDMSDDFEVRATVQPDFVDTPEEDFQIRIGVASDDVLDAGANAFILFDEFNDSTYLGTEAQPVFDESLLLTENGFDNSWVEFRLVSEADENVLKGKVWEYGTAEPAEFQAENDFSGVEGEFGMSTGGGGGPPMRHIYVDQVRVSDLIGLELFEFIYEHGSQVAQGPQSNQFVYGQGESVEDNGNSSVVFIQGSSIRTE